TSIYPFRSEADPDWLIREAHALGLTEVRVEYTREHVERATDDSVYDPAHYREPHPEIVDALRHSGLDVLLVLDGYHADAKQRPVDYPRLANGTVDGGAAAPGIANFARFAVEQTKDFVHAYELFNEPFNTM